MEDALRNRDFLALERMAKESPMALMRTAVHLDDFEIIVMLSERFPLLLDRPVVDEFGCGGSYDISGTSVQALGLAVTAAKNESLRGLLQCRSNRKAGYLEDGVYTENYGHRETQSPLALAILQNNTVAIELLYRAGASLTHQSNYFFFEIEQHFTGSVLTLIENNPKDSRVQMRLLLDRFSGSYRSKEMPERPDLTPPGVIFVTLMHKFVAKRRKEIYTWLMLYRKMGMSKDVGMMIAKDMLWKSRYCDFRESLKRK